MRSRSTLFLFAFLLLIASLAGAAAPAGPVTAADLPEATPACNPLLAKLGISALDPTSSAQSASTYVCGVCSDAICQGQTLGALCSSTKRCQAAYATECSQDGKPRCYCWGGQLP